jgi:hypothetical protein
MARKHERYRLVTVFLTDRVERPSAPVAIATFEATPGDPAVTLVLLKNLIDDRRINGLNHITEVAERVYLQAMRSPTSLHENRAYGQKKF